MVRANTNTCRALSTGLFLFVWICACILSPWGRGEIEESVRNKNLQIKTSAKADFLKRYSLLIYTGLCIWIANVFGFWYYSMLHEFIADDQGVHELFTQIFSRMSHYDLSHLSSTHRQSKIQRGINISSRFSPSEKAMIQNLLGSNGHSLKYWELNMITLQ